MNLSLKELNLQSLFSIAVILVKKTQPNKPPQQKTQTNKTTKPQTKKKKKRKTKQNETQLKKPDFHCFKNNSHDIKACIIIVHAIPLLCY